MALSLLLQCCMIMNHNLDLTDSRKIEFVIGFGYCLNQNNQTTMIIYIWNTIGYNSDTCTITMRINVYGILDVITSVISILTKIAILVSAFVILTVIFDEINDNLNKVSESKCCYDLNSNVCKKNLTTCVPPLISYKLFIFVVVIFFIMQVMDASSLRVVSSFEFDLFIQSSVGAAYCNTEMIRNVCVVFYSVFFLFVFSHFFEFKNVVLLIKYEIQYQIRENKQFQQGLIYQLAAISLILVLLYMVYQVALYVQGHEPVLIFLMLVMQCEIFSILMFHRMAFAVDNLFRVSLFTSLTIIIDGVGSNIAKINEFKYGYDRNSSITMILSSFGQSRVETKIFQNVIYDVG